MIVLTVVVILAQGVGVGLKVLVGEMGRRTLVTDRWNFRGLCFDDGCLCFRTKCEPCTVSLEVAVGGRRCANRMCSALEVRTTILC